MSTMAGAPKRISDLIFEYRFTPGQLGQQKSLYIQYTPLVQESTDTFSDVNQLSGSLAMNWENLPFTIQQKLETLERLIITILPSYEIDVGRSTALSLGPLINEIFCIYYTKPPTGIPSQLIAIYFFSTQPNNKTQKNLEWNSLSRSQQLVVSNVTSWVKKQAWEDLTNRIREIRGKPAEAIRRHKAFLSYKRRGKAEQMAETIAHRLSQQNIEVWFDNWEIKVGDSVTGKIGRGFKGIDACLVFIERQYSSSEWCTKEMNTALTKAINEKIVVIPILVEYCEMPELIKDLKPVYLIKPSASDFEDKLTEITDAIYKVDLNPYR